MKEYLYIGDLSKQDAKTLILYATNCSRILEYGVGGSTLLFAQRMKKGRLVSVDTDLTWIHATEAKLADLVCELDHCPTWPTFQRLDAPLDFDDIQLIFVDGHDDHRRGFALNAWPRLTPGGWMIFHDTRRLRDIQNVNAVIEANFEEVGDVTYNTIESNMTVVRKRHAKVTYENWNEVEGKQPWMYGLAEPPVDWVKKTTKVYA